MYEEEFTEENQREREAKRLAIAIRKKKMRRRRLIFRAFLSFILIFVVFEIVVHSPIFDVKSIEIKGNTKVEDASIVKAGKIKKGDNLYSIDEEDVKTNISKLLYVKSAKVNKEYPSGLNIKIVERKKEGYIKTGEKYALIDREGVVLDISDKPVQLTSIEGIGDIKVTKGDNLSDMKSKKLKLALEILSTSVSEKLFFKRIVITKDQVQLYALDKLYVSGKSDNVLKALKSGDLAKAIYRVYEEGIESGQIKVGKGKSFILSP